MLVAKEKKKNAIKKAGSLDFAITHLLNFTVVNSHF